MYRKKLATKSSIVLDQSTEGETIEMKIERIVNNKEPITDGAPSIYTERKDGVLAGYDIRTDRFEVALDAMEKVEKSYTAKREAKMKVVEKDKGSDSGAEPIGGAQSTEN